CVSGVRSGLCAHGRRSGGFDRNPIHAELQSPVLDAAVRLRLDTLDRHVHHRNRDCSRVRAVHHPPDPEGSMMARRSTGQQALLGIGAWSILIWSAAPFLWQLSTSLQLDKALTNPTPSLWPSPATLEHYANVFFVKHFQS